MVGGPRHSLLALLSISQTERLVEDSMLRQSTLATDQEMRNRPSFPFAGGEASSQHAGEAQRGCNSHLPCVYVPTLKTKWRNHVAVAMSCIVALIAVLGKGNSNARQESAWL